MAAKQKWLGLATARPGSAPPPQPRDRDEIVLPGEAIDESRRAEPSRAEPRRAGAEKSSRNDRGVVQEEPRRGVVLFSFG